MAFFSTYGTSSTQPCCNAYKKLKRKKVPRFVAGLKNFAPFWNKIKSVSTGALRSHSLKATQKSQHKLYIRYVWLSKHTLIPKQDANAWKIHCTYSKCSTTSPSNQSTFFCFVFLFQDMDWSLKQNKLLSSNFCDAYLHSLKTILGSQILLFWYNMIEWIEKSSCLRVRSQGSSLMRSLILQLKMQNLHVFHLLCRTEKQ